MDDFSVSVNNISKRYPLITKEARHNTLVGRILSFLYRPIKNMKDLRKLSVAQDKDSEIEGFIWALRHIELKAYPNEIIGIIGANGSGKTTLLKILSKISRPTEGEVLIKGKVASLLEVGTGFHHELTGRENIYLNGSVLGMNKDEIDENFDDILEFSGINEYIDTPIKRYSSGMRVRLAFSVAAHLDPDILIVDEVLAVGDADFQKKCLGKIDDVAQNGRTVFFVSHDLDAVMSICNRVIWIDDGKIIEDGGSRNVIQSYTQSLSEISKAEIDISKIDNRIRFKGDGAIKFKKLSLRNDFNLTSSFNVGDKFIIDTEYEIYKHNLLNAPIELVIKIKNQNMIDVLILSNKSVDKKLIVSDNKNKISCILPKLPIGLGVYSIDLEVKVSGGPADKINNVAFFEVLKGDYFGKGIASIYQSNFYTEYLWEQ